MPLVKWKEDGYLKKQGNKYADILALFACTVGIIYFVWLIKLPKDIILLVLPPFILVYAIIFRYLWTKGSRFDQGLDAEFLVTKELCKLPHAHFGFHDITLPDLFGNIDFVVVTTGRVFALEVKDTKHFSFEEHVKQAKRNALFLSRWLKKKIDKDVFVQPVVVYTNRKNRFFDNVMPKKDGAYIVRLSMLNRMLIRSSVQGYEAGDQIEIIQALKPFTEVHDIICE